ncbi:MAG: hypothetical protein CVT94_00950 [Bacteroidetes bacterium HGW-Bacteroidetes-11]|nr:MAG: hypothetical protein CVT94_00950 [Bacteroidetes bacterium HGW-Bacteroidetes-11]
MIQVNAQTEKNENIHFIKFKVYQGDFESGVPFAEMCISDIKNEKTYDCTITDFDGNAFFYINPNEYNPDSTYLKIRTLKGHTQNDYADPIKIPLNQIDILKDFDLENDLKMVVVDYKILNEKEHKKYRKKFRLILERNQTKVKDVK